MPVSGAERTNLVNTLKNTLKWSDPKVAKSEARWPAEWDRTKSVNRWLVGQLR